MILQPPKLAVPPEAVSGLAVQAKAAPEPGCVVMAKVIELVAVVTVLPPASWTVTAGWLPGAPRRAVDPATGLGGEGELGRRPDGDREGVAGGAGERARGGA